MDRISLKGVDDTLFTNFWQSWPVWPQLSQFGFVMGYILKTIQICNLKVSGQYFWNFEVKVWNSEALLFGVNSMKSSYPRPTPQIALYKLYMCLPCAKQAYYSMLLTQNVICLHSLWYLSFGCLLWLTSFAYQDGVPIYELIQKKL